MVSGSGFVAYNGCAQEGEQKWRIDGNAAAAVQSTVISGGTAQLSLEGVDDQKEGILWSGNLTGNISGADFGFMGYVQLKNNKDEDQQEAT